VRFADIAAASAVVAATSGRRAKVSEIARALRGLGPDEIAAGAAYLAGEIRQRQIGVGWAGLRDVPAPAEISTLTVGGVDTALAAIGAEGGPGSQARRRERLHALFAAATADEQQLLRGLISGELRQGAQAGLLADAIAVAAEVPAASVRRALLLAGDIKAVAVAALTGGAVALDGFHLSVGRPLAPMLAAAASTLAEALATTGVPAAVDAKLDGVRIQVHRSGDDVGIFTRSLDDVTARMPEVVAAVRALPVGRLVLDGEAIALDRSGRPRPFQETSSRAAQRGRRAARSDTPSAAEPANGPGVGSAGVAAAGTVRRDGSETVLTPYFFDLLHLDGTDLIDEPAHARWAALERALPERLLVARAIAGTPDDALAAYAKAIDAGHEGVVVKSMDASYDVGRRGGAWVKVKPRHTLDLVVLAAEWGHGRRRGWLSNLHLAARDPVTGDFVMLGKTFKGLTDELLRWQTEQLLARAVSRNDWVVTVRPELVVEIAFDGVQTSPRYPGGMALRFARVLRYRPDKTAAEADTVDTLRAIHSGQSLHSGQSDDGGQSVASDRT
jgi:DNA ligase-1